jgi:hypothetical protein
LDLVLWEGQVVLDCGEDGGWAELGQVTGEELVDEALLDFVVDSQKYNRWRFSYHQTLVGVCVDQVLFKSSAVGLIDQSVLL